MSEKNVLTFIRSDPSNLPGEINPFKYLILFEGRTLLLLIKSWIILRSLTTLLVILTLVSILSFCLCLSISLNFLKVSHELVSKSLLKRIDFLFLEDPTPTENFRRTYFILYSFCNLVYIDRTWRWLKARVDNLHHNVKNCLKKTKLSLRKLEKMQHF